MADSDVALSQETIDKIIYELSLPPSLALLHRTVVEHSNIIRSELKASIDTIVVDENGTTVQGPKGDTGDIGPQGLAGPKGDKGDQGDVGPQGSKGDQGDQGIQGIQGAAGIKGDTGATGATGADGQAGAQGPKGDTGTAGAQGVKGDTGNTGPAGQGLTNRGTWAAANTYAPFDIVQFNNSSYICKIAVTTPTTTTPISDTSTWGLFATGGQAIFTGQSPQARFDVTAMTQFHDVSNFSTATRIRSADYGRVECTIRNTDPTNSFDVALVYVTTDNRNPPSSGFVTVGPLQKVKLPAGFYQIWCRPSVSGNTIRLVVTNKVIA